MDDNELENEREKREHELELAKLEYPRGWESFWEMIGDNLLWIFLIISAIVVSVVKIKTSQNWSF